jgi:hypothetical protein
MDEQSDDPMDALESTLLPLGWPPALVKACADPFTYACQLRTGLIVHFESAIPSRHADWVHLRGSHLSSNGPVVEPPVFMRNTEFMHGRPMSFDRGLDVRVADIVWVADAPWGS